MFRSEVLQEWLCYVMCILVLVAGIPPVALAADGPWPFDPAKPYGIDRQKVWLIDPNYNAPELPPNPAPSAVFGDIDGSEWNPETMSLMMDGGTIYWVVGLDQPQFSDDMTEEELEALLNILYPNGWDQPPVMGNYYETKLAQVGG